MTGTRSAEDVDLKREWNIISCCLPWFISLRSMLRSLSSSTSLIKLTSDHTYPYICIFNITASTVWILISSYIYKSYLQMCKSAIEIGECKSFTNFGHQMNRCCIKYIHDEFFDLFVNRILTAESCAWQSLVLDERKHFELYFEECIFFLICM